MAYDIALLFGFGVVGALFLAVGVFIERFREYTNGWPMFIPLLQLLLVGLVLFISVMVLLASYALVGVENGDVSVSGLYESLGLVVRGLVWPIVISIFIIVFGCVIIGADKVIKWGRNFS